MDQSSEPSRDICAPPSTVTITGDAGQGHSTTDEPDAVSSPTLSSLPELEEVESLIDWVPFIRPPVYPAWSFLPGNAETPTVRGRHALPSMTEFLGRITNHPARFRDFMRAEGVVLSGSYALSFFDPTVKFGDVDMYTDDEHFGRVVARLVLEFDGDLLHCGRQYYNGGLKQVARVATPLVKFDVIRSVNMSASYPIGWFWCTAVKNAITADMFCMAYPWLTLQHLGLYCGDPDDVDEAVLNKYTARGYQFAGRASDFHEVSDAHDGSCLVHHFLCTKQFRHLGDAGCLWGKFDKNGYPTLNQPGQEVVVERETAIWKIDSGGCGGCCRDGSGRRVALITQ